jgi:pimeloyl-ACP methyl ester carboxylesterase
MKAIFLRMTAVILMLAGFFLLPAPASAKQNLPAVNPIIFVHGGSGSGAQFESQAQRFTSNGYPHDYIAVLEYDSSHFTSLVSQIYANLDQLIASLLEKTGADQVDILGHSLGTTLMYGYLTSTPERAAKVAHYVNIDGQTTLPDGVDTLALWAGRGTPGRTMVGATNVTIPDVTHVECATSPLSFVEMYKFFTGEAPATTDIVPEPPGQVRLAGRAVIFPENRGAEDRTLEIWRVDGDTGARIDKKPDAVFPIDADGAWGPFNAKGGQNYEFVLLLEGAFTHHLYYEPFYRSDYLIRLNTEEPGTGVGSILSTSDHTSDLIIIRYKEFWGDQGAENDTLAIDGVNVVQPALCPISRRVNAIFCYDNGLDGVSDLSAPILPFGLPFLTGVDLFVPGADPPDATISNVLTPRGGGGMEQVVNVPNWASSDHRITIQFHDYVQAINSFVEYVQSK